MTRIPEHLTVALAELLRARHADSLFAPTLGLLGGQILDAPRPVGEPAMLDTATMRQLIRVYARVGALGSLPAVLELIEPWLPLLVRETVILAGPPALTEIPGRPETLSNREIEVLVGMANGLSNSDIGRRIYISEDTVKSHARRLFKKLGVNDRAHAVRVGIELGVLPIKIRGTAASVA